MCECEETVKNTLKGGGTEGRGHKDFKKEGQAGSRGGCVLKRGLAGTSLRTMIYIIFQINHKSPFTLVKDNGKQMMQVSRFA